MCTFYTWPNINHKVIVILSLKHFGIILLWQRSMKVYEFWELWQMDVPDPKWKSEDLSAESSADAGKIYSYWAGSCRRDAMSDRHLMRSSSSNFFGQYPNLNPQASLELQGSSESGYISMCISFVLSRLKMSVLENLFHFLDNH